MKEQILREVPEKRERCVKHFQMNEKGMAAAVYPAPVHYEEDGLWKEIDNRLEERELSGKRFYQNKSSAIKVRFAEESGGDALVTVEKEGVKLSWKMNESGTQIREQIAIEANGTRNVTGEGEQRNRSTFRILTEPEFWEKSETYLFTDSVNNVNVAEESEEPEKVEEVMESERLGDQDVCKKMSVSNLVSEGIYDEILPDIDLHYALQGETIKENIRLNSKEAAGQFFSFTFAHPGLRMKKEADGGIGLYQNGQEDEVFYKLVKPYMYDQIGTISWDVEFQIETKGEESVVKILPDREWLYAEERQYPVVIDPMTETSKTQANIEDTYIFTGGTDSEDPAAVYAYGSFLAGTCDELGKMRALLRFKNLPNIGKGSIIYAATMYIWQYEYSTYGTATIPLVAYEVKNSWTEKNARWSNQPSVDSLALDYKTIGQVQNGNTTTITPVGFDVTRLVRQWYNTGKNYGIMIQSKYESETDVEKRAYARFYSSDYPKMSSDQYPSGVFYYRNVNGLEDYQSYHEQSAGRAGMGYVNDFTGNLVWIHPDIRTNGGPMCASIQHVYNSSEASVSSRLGYGWTLDCLQKMNTTGITDYPYVYTDGDGTKHYFYKDTSGGNKLKDEDGLGFTITATTGADYDHGVTMETKDKVKYIFGKDGFIRFVEDLDGNTITYEYEPNSTQNYIDYITDATGGRLELVYKEDASLSRIMAVRDMAGREVSYTYDDAGNLARITYPDGEKTTFTYDDAHKLLSVTNPEGYCISYTYTDDFRVPRISRIREEGNGEVPGQELKISYENGNTTIFEEPGLDGELNQEGDNKKIIYHFDNMGRPTDVMDSDGYANNYEYYSAGMKNHKLSKSGSMQKTVYGLLKNHLFSSTSHWYSWNSANDEQGTIETTTGYMGTGSAKIQKTEKKSDEGIAQEIQLKAGTYTFSAYVKTEGLEEDKEINEEALTGAALEILREDGMLIRSSRSIDYVTDDKIDGGWERLSLTFDLETEATVRVTAGLFGMKGVAWISGAQLEKGTVANKLNLVSNPGFEYKTDGKLDNWSASIKTSEDAEMGTCALLNSAVDQKVNCAQSISISGEEGEIYHVSCWVNGLGIPGKHFSLSAAVIYSDDTVVWHHFQCNLNIKGWQFMNKTFSTDNGDDSTKKTYRAIHVYLMSHNQMNPMLYKGVQLIRDDGETFLYDADGNLTNAKSAAENTHFVSDKKGSLTKLGNIDGTVFQYGYDEKNHLVSASNSEGVRYAFEYDSKGQPIKTIVEGGKHLRSVTVGRSYYIREKISGKYLDIKDASIKNNGVIQLYEFQGGSRQKWKIADAGKGYVFLQAANNPAFQLDLKKMNDTDGATIQLYSSNTSDAQKWKLHPKWDGSYQISNCGTKDKRGLSNASKSTSNGAAVTSYTLADSNKHQDWYFEPADEGTISAEPGDGKIVSIRVRHSGQYIDVQKLKTDAGSRTMQHYYNGGMNQKFRLIAVDGTYYQIEPLHAPGMVLAKNGKNSGGYPILALDDANPDAASQLFRFEPVASDKENGYAIICKDSNLALDVMNYSYTNTGDIILTAHKSTQVNKWWILEEYSERMESSLTYTSDGRQVESITDTRGNTVHYEYDEMNQLLQKMTDARGSETKYTYDPNTDRLTSVQTHAGDQEIQVEYTYENDRIKTITHHGFEYSYEYDPYGNLASISVGDTKLQKIRYLNRNGLVDQVTYATGECIRNEYDQEERLIGQYLRKPDGTEEKLYTNQYDYGGTVVVHEDHRSGIISRYQYDMIGRLLGEDQSYGQKIRISYDDKNRVRSYLYQMDKNGHETGFLYGEAEKLQRPGLNYGVTIDGTERIRYRYDELGRIVTQYTMCGEGVEKEIRYTYLPGLKPGVTTNLIASVEDEWGTTFYTYDENGNITEIRERAAESTESVCKARYQYDELNQLIREDNAEQDATIIYTYDAGGNLLTRKIYPYTEAEILEEAAAEIDVYAYRTEGWKDQLLAYNGQTIEYDAMGNPLVYRGRTMEWDKGRGLRSITTQNLRTVYTYDNSGNRIQKTVNGVTTEYCLNGANILAQKSSDGTRLDFLYDENGKVIALEYNNALYYYRKNMQGDILGIIDSTGSEVVTYSYDSWGRPLQLIDQSGCDLGKRNPFRYRGYYYDEDTGFYYVSSRYYDPEAGRFISADGDEVLTEEYQNLVQYNLYAYCFNNPTNMADADGMWPSWASAVVGVVVIAGLAAVTAMAVGNVAVISGAALTGAIVGGGAGIGVGYARGGVDGALNGFGIGTVAGGVIGAGLALTNIKVGGVQIIGKAQKTGTPFHKMASNIKAGQMAMQPGHYSKITFDRALKTAGLEGRKRPDVIGVARYGSNKIVEVVSKSQTSGQMSRKCDGMIDMNPNSKKSVVGWPGKLANIWKKIWH